MPRHEPYWPVIGGAAECKQCGKQNYDSNEECKAVRCTCSLNEELDYGDVLKAEDCPIHGNQ